MHKMKDQMNQPKLVWHNQIYVWTLRSQNKQNSNKTLQSNAWKYLSVEV